MIDIGTDTGLDFLDDRVRGVVERLEVAARADGDVIGAVSVRLRELGATPDAETLRAMTATGEAAMLPVARSVGRLLFQLAVGSGAATIVEYGTSHGMSTLYLAAAAQRTGAQVIGTELSAHKAAVATANLAEAGVGDRVRVLVGDALETLPTVSGPVGLLLLDGWLPLHLPVFRAMEPKLTLGSIIVSDNVSRHADLLDDFHRYIAERSQTYLRTTLPLDDGIDVIVRVR
ncbi:O-methyltransferase [Nocardia kruczakiae]|uniref:O-methyltransferase n=1 Tax=Nocardia kruczakiae TaxID=261477 RepID=UPI0007A3A118|nr:class I SAM-dependent methyltransferase [Nocardia kruczakiae]